MPRLRGIFFFHWDMFDRWPYATTNPEEQKRTVLKYADAARAKYEKRR